MEDGGAEGDRTPDLRNAIATLSQLSYGPDPASDWAAEAFRSVDLVKQAVLAKRLFASLAVIARSEATKQSMRPGARLDCFARGSQ